MKMVTNFVKASYKELYDIASTPNKPTLIGIHTPTSIRPVALLQGFWSQYKKFKYVGCKLTLVPVHSRPLDIQQIGVEAGKGQTNPKDLLNPVLSKGYIGESLGYFFDSYLNANISGYTRIPGSSADISNPTSASDSFKNWYYQNLLTKGWRKTLPNQPLSMSGLSPRLWALGVNHPILSNINHDASNLGVSAINGLTDSFGSDLTPMIGTYGAGVDGNDSLSYATLGPAPATKAPELNPGVTGVYKSPWTFSTYRTVPLSWQDTIVNTWAPTGVTDGTTTVVGGTQSSTYTTVGKHFMAVIVLPPSETTVQYWRMVITHYFAFKGFRYSFINAPGRATTGNSALPIQNTSATVSLGVNPVATINWPEDTSEAKGILDTDIGDIGINESGTVDVVDGTVEFVSDTTL